MRISRIKNFLKSGVSPTERLVIQFSRANHEVNWSVIDAEGRVLQGPAYSLLADVSHLAKNRSVWVIVPGEEVLLTHAHIPKLSYRQLVQAIPYALEEQLAEDVESLHFAIGQFSEDKNLPVAVMRREQIQMYLTQLQNASISADGLFSSSLTIPWQDKTWSVVFDGEQALVRTAKQQGFTVEIEHLIKFLSFALDEAGSARPERIVLRNYPSELSADGFFILPVPVEFESHTPSKEVLLATSLNPIDAINLLQGDYQAKRLQENTQKIWRWTLALMIIFVGLSIVTQLGRTVYLHGEHYLLQRKMMGLYKTVFPSAEDLSSAQVRLTRELQLLQGSAAGGRFFYLLTKAGVVLHAMPSVELRGLDFQADHLTLDVASSDAQALQNLKSAWVSQGLTVRQVTAIHSANNAEAQFIIGDRP
jgi:general secretion pathway protein L